MQANNVVDNDLKDIIQDIYLSIERNTENNITKIEVKQGKKNVQTHRALILQGGGALGAYEAGVVKALYEQLSKEDEENSQNKDKPIFDIIAGTSIGAINAALIVNYVIKQKRKTNKSISESWKDVDLELYNFWDDISSPFGLFHKGPENTFYYYSNSFFKPWRDIFFDYANFILEYNIGIYKIFWDIGNYIPNILIAQAKQLTNFSKSFGHIIGLQYFPIIPYFDEHSPFFYTSFASLTENWREYRPHIFSFFYWPDNIGNLASGETARRFYSHKLASIFGTPNVISHVIWQPNWKFVNLINPLTFLELANPLDYFARYDNNPLINLLERYYWWDNEKSEVYYPFFHSQVGNAKPLVTSPDRGEPRLLVVSVDIQDCSTAVTFDSYAKDNDKYKTVYGEDPKYTIDYEGIIPEHINASASIHQKYKYPHFPAKVEYSNNKKIEGHPSSSNPDRYFWDGAYLSNTPLREVIQAHREYWHKIRKQVVPDLEVYILDLYPRTEKSYDDAIADADLIQDRETDIQFHNRTNYDLKVSELTTDYINLITLLVDASLKDFSNDNNKKEELLNKFKDIFNSTFTMSEKRNRKKEERERKLGDLIDGRFSITKVVKIERQDDGNTIYGKAFEFSHTTIKNLREQGYQDGKETYKEGKKVLI